MLDYSDIQGLIAHGYTDRPAAAYALFAIRDPERVRAWLGRLVDQLQFADFLATARDQAPFLEQEPLNIAFTYAGLAKLELMAEALAGFGQSFREGMHAPHRARQLGDDEGSAPERWHWGGPHQVEIHGLLCAFGGTGDGDDANDAQLDQRLRAELSFEHGVELLKMLPAQRTSKKDQRKEHFGFRDGVSNPHVAGLSRGSGIHAIPAGEVLLGHVNAYGKVGRTPRVRSCDDSAGRLPPYEQEPALRDFGKNGSYLVFRQLEQDVAAFWRYANEASAQLGNGKDGVWLASRMLGRWPDGSPLTLHPERDSPAESSDMNEFLFEDHHDTFGERCPIGSHMRRCNPRDTRLPTRHELRPGASRRLREQQERVARANAHRILRRGRAYGPPLHPSFEPSEMLTDDGQSRGLYFLCFNANLRRQFEFVQSSWLISPSFAGLSADPDPLVGSHRSAPFAASDFTIQGCPARRVTSVPRVVETRGGAYFFMPSRSALLFLSQLSPPCLERIASRESHEALALTALHMDKIQRDFARQAQPARARRGFHEKCHGIVRATVKVDSDLAPAFRAGVFVPGAQYRAWVRFSSASFGLQPDTRRDVHGLALKLLGVPHGPRAALFERHTQDFLLLDTKTLMVGTVRQALHFDRAQVKGGLHLLTHLATHLGETLAIARMASAPRHLFEREYSSVAAFAHGRDRAVRYVVRVAPGQTLASVPPAENGLRASLRAQLAQGDLKLELCLQVTGLDRQPIEDARVNWRNDAQRVATVTLHPQGFESPEQELLGERLSFNPWNALEAHRPLGGLNRARRIVYRAVYELRTRLTRHNPIEPIDAEEVHHHDHPPI